MPSHKSQGRNDVREVLEDLGTLLKSVGARLQLCRIRGCICVPAPA